MVLEIHLLGVPRVVRDGKLAPAPRGHKAWGLLAWLLCGAPASTRSHLAAQLFENAEDPLAALRWNLSELRRLLGDVDLGGEALRLALPPQTLVDVHVLGRPCGPDTLALPGLGRELLEGMHFDGAPAFAVWLDSQRRRFCASSEALLREAALARLGSGSANEAAEIAARLVQLNPLDEHHQALLVRSLAAAGDGIAAARQVAACTELFRRQLGVRPGSVLAAAAATTTANAVARPSAGRAAAHAQLEAGEAAVRAGAHEAGLECLRRAASEADALADVGLRVRARLALGGALIHAAKGRDEEGVVALHEALAIAEPEGMLEAATACRELGYTEFLAGRYERAIVWLNRARSLACNDATERSAIDTVHGAALSDTAQYGLAEAILLRAVSLADEGAQTRQLAYGLSMLGRVHLLHGELGRAAENLDRSVALGRAAWTAFVPWPQALRAEVDLKGGDIERAAEGFEQAFALGCQLGDPCWKSVAGRGMGLVARARGQFTLAVEMLSDAVATCARESDSYQWARARALESLCDVAVAQRLPQARGWVDELQKLASRADMRELVALAHLHASRLGDRGSALAGQALFEEIRKPTRSGHRALSIEPPN